ncbi:MAG: ABC transporter ATP-binding protein [Tissierellia bacterium]|nr:ABC transporter ATP-binding protein [Tissierellia bacterium]
MAISTGYFVDTVILIYRGYKSFSNIYLALFILIAIIGFIIIIENLYTLILSKIKYIIENALLPSIIEIEAKVKYSYIENSNYQETIGIVSDEMEETFIDCLESYLTIIRSIIGISSIIIILIKKIWWVSLLILIFSIPLIIVSLWAGRKNYLAKVDTRKYEMIYSYYSDDILCNRNSVYEKILFEYTDDINDRYYEKFDKSSKIQLKVLLKTRFLTKLTSVSFMIITMITSLSLINPLISGNITPGVFTGIVTALIGMSKILGWQFQDATRNIGEAREYMDGLTDIILMDSINDATDIANKLPINFKKIEFKNVYFKYPNSENNVLNGVSFTIENGKHYAFVGSNGAGKSTVTKLLTGLYSEYEGEILIDGKDIRSFNQATLKSLFSVIYQDFSCYEISIRDNINLGNLGKN